MTIKELRILPPFAIGRLGAADEPLDNFTTQDDPDHPLGFRRIVGAETLVINEHSGEIKESKTPDTILFKQGERIRPVAPFLELFAEVEGEGALQPLYQVLKSHSQAKIEWCVKVDRKSTRLNSSH